MDKKEQVARIEEKMSYLTLALENYAKALIKSDKHDLKVKRILEFLILKKKKCYLDVNRFDGTGINVCICAPRNFGE